jgi:hypothetical protein
MPAELGAHAPEMRPLSTVAAICAQSPSLPQAAWLRTELNSVHENAVGKQCMLVESQLKPVGHPLPHDGRHTRSSASGAMRVTHVEPAAQSPLPLHGAHGGPPMNALHCPRPKSQIAVAPPQSVPTLHATHTPSRHVSGAAHRTEAHGSGGPMSTPMSTGRGPASIGGRATHTPLVHVSVAAHACIMSHCA